MCFSSICYLSISLLFSFFFVFYFLFFTLFSSITHTATAISLLLFSIFLSYSGWAGEVGYVSAKTICREMPKPSSDSLVLVSPILSLSLSCALSVGPTLAVTLILTLILTLTLTPTPSL